MLTLRSLNRFIISTVQRAPRERANEREKALLALAHTHTHFPIYLLHLVHTASVERRSNQIARLHCYPNFSPLYRFERRTVIAATREVYLGVCNRALSPPASEIYRTCGTGGIGALCSVSFLCAQHIRFRKRFAS